MKKVRESWPWNKHMLGGIVLTSMPRYMRLFLPEREFGGWASGRSILGFILYAVEYWVLRATSKFRRGCIDTEVEKDLLRRLAEKDRSIAP